MPVTTRSTCSWASRCRIAAASTRAVPMTSEPAIASSTTWTASSAPICRPRRTASAASSGPTVRATTDPPCASTSASAASRAFSSSSLRVPSPPSRTTRPSGPRARSDWMSGTCFTQTTILTRGTLPPAPDRTSTRSRGGDTRHVWALFPHNVRVTPPSPRRRAPRLGVHVTDEGVDVAVYAAHATGVDLCLFDGADESAASRSTARCTACSAPPSPASAPASGTASARTARGSPRPATATTPPSCWSTRTPAGSTARSRTRPETYGHVVGRRPRGRPVRSRGPARLRRPRPVLGRRRHPRPARPGPDRQPPVDAVVAHGRLRGPRPRPDHAGRPAARGAARHLRRPGAPRGRRPPARPGRHRDRAAPGARVLLRAAPRREGPDQLLGLQHARLLRPARGLRDGGRAGGRPGGRARRAARRGPRAARGRPRGAARRRLQPHLRGRAARPAPVLARPRQRHLLRARRRGARRARGRHRHREHARLPAGRGGPDDARLAAVLGGRRRASTGSGSTSR